MQELTIDDVLNDPMIAMVRRADKVDNDWFRDLLHRAARPGTERSNMLVLIPDMRRCH